MKKFLGFFKTAVIGGVTIVLPMVLTFLLLRWLFRTVTGWIHPLTKVVMAASPLQKTVADLLVIALIILICFTVGLIVKTRFGNFLHRNLEKRILKVAPGYTLFRETIKQFLGQTRTPFSRVALVRIFDSSALMTAFVSEEHENGYFTVYVPSGLNPTTGLIFHLEPDRVNLIDVPVEEAMRSIIGCGTGSSSLLKRFNLPG